MTNEDIQNKIQEFLNQGGKIILLKPHEYTPYNRFQALQLIKLG